MGWSPLDGRVLRAALAAFLAGRLAKFHPCQVASAWASVSFLPAAYPLCLLLAALVKYGFTLEM